MLCPYASLHVPFLLIQNKYECYDLQMALAEGQTVACDSVQAEMLRQAQDDGR